MRADLRLRVVIDSNVWISAALTPGGTPAQVVRHVLKNGLPVFSPATFEELRSRLWKPKFDRWLSLEQRQRLLHDVDACALWVALPASAADTALRHYSRDPDDDAFIHTALAAQAPWLITGDQDLLAVHQPLPVTILTPAAALAEARFMAVQV